jgi:hypothetical protein
MAGLVQARPGHPRLALRPERRGCLGQAPGMTAECLVNVIGKCYRAPRRRPHHAPHPAGRQRGSRNKATLAFDAMLETRAEELTNRLAAMTSAGHSTAMRICFDRLAPVGKGRPARFSLSKLETQADAVDAAAAIVAGAADGELTPQEAEGLIKLVEAFGRVRTVADLEWRVTKLERALSKDA